MYIHESFDSSEARNVRYAELKAQYPGVTKYSEPVQFGELDQHTWKTVYYVTYPQPIITDYRDLIPQEGKDG